MNNCAGGVTPWGTVLSDEENFKQYFGNADLLGDATAKAKLAATASGEPLRNASGSVSTRVSTSRSRVQNHNLGILDEGTLYAARFTGDSPGEIDGSGRLSSDGEFDGTGQWIRLIKSNANGTGESFVAGMSVPNVLVHTRLAADTVGATKMDRPEDVEPHPRTGKVYVALTNNSRRGVSPNPAADEPNPRNANRHGRGHVLELTEDGDNPAATTFTWKLLLVCGDPNDPSTYFAGFPKNQVSPISCPDNVAFDPVGNLWISNDGNALRSNDRLFAVPVDSPFRRQVKQFLTVPIGAETRGPVIEERLALVAV